MGISKRRGKLIISHRPILGIAFFLFCAIGAFSGAAVLLIEENQTEAGLGVAALGIAFLATPMLMSRIILTFDKKHGSATRLWQALGGFRKNLMTLDTSQVDAVIYRVDERRDRRGRRYRQWAILLHLRDGREMPFYPHTHPCPYPKMAKKVADFMEVPIKEDKQDHGEAASFPPRDYL